MSRVRAPLPAPLFSDTCDPRPRSPPSRSPKKSPKLLSPEPRYLRVAFGRARRGVTHRLRDLLERDPGGREVTPKCMIPKSSRFREGEDVRKLSLRIGFLVLGSLM